DGRDRDDPTALARPHHRHDQRLHDVVERVEVGPQDAVPGIRAHAGERRVRVEARIADDAVEGAVLLDVARELLRGGLALGDVELEQRALAARGADLGERRGGVRRALAVVDRYGVARARQVDGDRAADAAT